MREAPDARRLVAALGDMMTVHCGACRTDSDRTWVEDHLDDGWALTAEVELCPACNDLDDEELEAFNDADHPYWDRQDAERLLASGHGLS